MPEALATSKRKFHRLLDSITAASNALPAQHKEHAASASSLHVLTARERLDAASDRARKRLRPSTSSTSLATSHHQPSISAPTTRTHHHNNTSATSLSRAAMATSSDGSTKKEIPHFAPWSQESFLARLQTFSKVSLWHPKPAAISEIRWAKRGWQCVDLNTVACKGGCEKRVVVKLDTTGRVVREALRKGMSERGNAGDESEDDELDEAELEKALAQRYEDEIVNGHAETCMWRKPEGCCKDDIYRLSLVRPVIWQPDLRKRYASLLTIAPSIENVTFRSLPRNTDTTLLSPPDLLTSLPPSILSVPEDTSPNLSTKALDIALHGWRGDSDLGIDLLHCDACFQRIGLWMYQPGYKPGRGIILPPDGSEPEVHTVNLVEMHRLHCPWQSAKSQQATGTLAGMTACQILNRVVSGFAREERRKSEQGGVVDLDDDEDGVEVEVPKLSKEEIERLDREREGKLRRLKRMFTVKRASKVLGG